MMESLLERKVTVWAKDNGILSTKLSSPSYRGVPDRIFWVAGGAPIIIEFKSKNGALSKLQAEVIKKLTNLKYKVEVINDFESAKAILSPYVVPSPIPEHGSK